MVLNESEPMFTTDDDNSTSTFSPADTPDETNDPDDHESTHSATPTVSSVPWPDSTFIIRASDRVLTLLDGKVVLKRPGGPGSIHWACVESKGWLGFRNVVSGKFLGYNTYGELRCAADRHREWEQFCVRAVPDGGYVFLMTDFSKLLPVGWKAEKEVVVLAKLSEKKMAEGIVWEFAKVSEGLCGAHED